MSDPLEARAMLSPGPFAPYPVWLTLRIVTTIGAAMVFVWVGWAIVCLFRGAAGEDFTLLPGWIGIVGLVIGADSRRFGPVRDLPPFGETIGHMLAAKGCPVCGQSIFDHTPPSGYAADVERRCFWPSRRCTNCGHDMMVRDAA